MNNYQQRVEASTKRLDEQLLSLQVRAQALRTTYGVAIPHQDDWDDTLVAVLSYVGHAIQCINDASRTLREGS